MNQSEFIADLDVMQIGAVRTHAADDVALGQNTDNLTAGILHQHLRCAHPQGLDGPVYLAHGDDADLNRILASLSTQLATQPIAALTSSDANAEWILSVDASRSGTGSNVQQLGLLLTEQARGTTQQVATVYVSGGVSGGDPPGSRP